MLIHSPAEGRVLKYLEKLDFPPTEDDTRKPLEECAQMAGVRSPCLAPLPAPFPPHRHVEDLLESFELVGLEVEGDLPLLLQQWNGGKVLLSCYLVFCFEVISCFPWTCKNANIFLCFKNNVSYTHLNAATSFPLILGLLLRLPPTEKNEEKSREPGDEEEQSHADVKAKEPD